MGGLKFSLGNSSILPGIITWRLFCVRRPRPKKWHSICFVKIRASQKLELLYFKNSFI
jgi:hypothetical protein